MTKSFIFSGLLSILIVLGGCSHTLQKKSPPATPDAKRSHSDSENMKAENMKKNDESHSPSMAMPGELSAAEAAQYKNDLPLEQRLKLAEDLAMKMPKNGMKQMTALFPDMKKSQEIGANDAKNLLKMGPETWYFSPEGNITVAVCTETDAPMHVFVGANPSITEIEAAAKMMHEMGGMDMGMMEHPATETASLSEPMYVEYSDALYTSLLGKKPFALFFHASWCPTCRGMESAILSELKNFPHGTEIIKADYDTMTELKKKYGVVTQSTIVFIDAKGEVSSTLMAPDNTAIKNALRKTL